MNTPSFADAHESYEHAINGWAASDWYEAVENLEFNLEPNEEKE